ncbi:ABC transporter substrate-binding protein, partial [Pseudomonas sp. JAI120]|uniref:ABC transporter substrate-binding protein n=1 Tax=Pseudomonas sp. JAI120 TaxID=2723063 RepID=UPI0030EE12FE
KSWTFSDDGLTYTFKLQSGVKWHDGKPFTADDVVFSANVFLRETHARLRASLAYFVTITAPDAETVVFKLKQPFGPFLGIFEVGSMPMVPKHLYEGTDWKTNAYNNAPVGTGPFVFKSYQKDSNIRYTGNKDYWKPDDVKIDNLI